MKNLFLLSISVVAIFSVLMFDSVFAGVLVYSTYLGGNNWDFGYGITVDSSGNVYITGQTDSFNYPVTPGALDTSYNGYYDIFVTKVDSTGTALIYSTYLGGEFFDDRGYGIAVDNSGNVYLTGETDSFNFPVTPGAFDTSYNGSGDAFVTKLNATGTGLVYSTYLGGEGSDSGTCIALDSAGNIYLTGYCWFSTFPTTPGAYDTSYNGTYDVFVAKLNPSGTGLNYSTYLGGGFYDQGYSIAIDSSENAYITGWTHSYDFPVTPGAFDTSFNGIINTNGFVTKLNPSGTALVYSTYLGSENSDICRSIAIDNSGNAYLTGFTDSSTFPTTPGAFDTSYNGGSFWGDVFVTKLNPSGTALVYSTYLGGRDDDYGYGIAIDSLGSAYLTGYTSSTDFSTTLGAFDTLSNGSTDVYVSKLNGSGTALIYSTYLGGSLDDYGWGIALDSLRNIYITGDTNSSDFPTTPGAFDTSLNGGYDVFVTKLSLVPLSFVNEWNLYEE